jgi:hypothetical protein
MIVPPSKFLARPVPSKQNSSPRDNTYLLTKKSLFNCIKRIANPEYVPNDIDILTARVKTTGITETSLEFSGIKARFLTQEAREASARNGYIVLITSMLWFSQWM